MQGKAEADPFGVRAWWRQTCPETVRQLSQTLRQIFCSDEPVCFLLPFFLLLLRGT